MRVLATVSLYWPPFLRRIFIASQHRRAMYSATLRYGIAIPLVFQSVCPSDAVKAKFHWDQFLVTSSYSNCYEKVADEEVGRVANLLRWSWRRRQQIREEVTRNWSPWNMAFIVSKRPSCYEREGSQTVEPETVGLVSWLVQSTSVKWWSNELRNFRWPWLTYTRSFRSASISYVFTARAVFASHVVQRLILVY